MVILAKFNPGDNWSGDLEALGLDSATGEWDVPLWKASDVIPASRNVFTIDPVTTFVAEYTDATLDRDNFLCKDIGDIINSIPIIVESPPYNYDFDGYESWKRSVSRDPMVYVGANDGLLHAFSLGESEDANAQTIQAGEEKWAFLPLNLHDKLNKAFSDVANTISTTNDMCDTDYCHQYFVDGSPKVADIYDSSNWKTILVSGERQGGEAYFALDITTGNFNVDTSYMWQFTDTELGETWGEVSFARVAGTTWGAFFGSGYSPNNQSNKEAYLYGINANDATPLWSDANGSTNRIKLSTDELKNDATSAPLLADFQGDDISDALYVGNLYGKLYRVSNIGQDEIPSISTFFDFSTPLATPNINPIRAQANYAYGEGTNNIWVFYGTGRYETQLDKSNSNQQFFFGLKDNLDTPISHSGLPKELEAKYKIYTAEDGTQTQIRYIDGACTEESWVIKLYNGQGNYDGPSGTLGSERVIEKSLVVGGIVFFTTFIPDQDVCAGNGQAWVFAVDYNTGCTPEEPVFDLNEDGLFDDRDKVTIEGDESTDEDDILLNVAGIPVGGDYGNHGGGQGSKPVMHKDNLFITTTGGSGGGGQLTPLKVNVPGMKVKMNSWKN